MLTQNNSTYKSYFHNGDGRRQLPLLLPGFPNEKGQNSLRSSAMTVSSVGKPTLFYSDTLRVYPTTVKITSLKCILFIRERRKKRNALASSQVAKLAWLKNHLCQCSPLLICFCYCIFSCFDLSQRFVKAAQDALTAHSLWLLPRKTITYRFPVLSSPFWPSM